MEREEITMVMIEKRLKDLHEQKSYINLRDCYECTWINNLYFSINNEIDMLEEEKERLNRFKRQRF